MFPLKSQSESGEMEMIHDSESFKWSNMMNLTRWFCCRNANHKYKKMVPKSSDFKEAGGSLTLGNLFFGLWHMTVLVQYSFRSHMCANVLLINYNFGFHDSLSFVVCVIEYVSMVVNKESIINFPTFKWRNDLGIYWCFFRPKQKIYTTTKMSTLWFVENCSTGFEI